MVGFLLQWPTLPTLVMFPFLVIVYRRLASSEERSVRREFADVWDDYAAATPRFIPRPPATQPPAPPPRPRRGRPIDRPGARAHPGAPPSPRPTLEERPRGKALYGPV